MALIFFIGLYLGLCIQQIFSGPDQIVLEGRRQSVKDRKKLFPLFLIFDKHLSAASTEPMLIHGELRADRLDVLLSDSGAALFHVADGILLQPDLSGKFLLA